MDHALGLSRPVDRTGASRSGSRAGLSGPGVGPTEDQEARLRSIALIGSRGELPGRFRFPAPPATGLRQVEEWFRKVRGASVSTDLSAIVTGPLAADLAPGGVTFGHERVRSVWPNAARVLVEGTDVPSGVLAGGAALYAARIAADMPTYLDTLPRLRTVVRCGGEPQWEFLLQENDQFVEGGKLWRRRPNLDGLAIPKLSPELVIALDHAEYRTVRQVAVPLGCEFDCPELITLAVSIEPAQGGAKIEVVPQDRPLFGRRRVFVEWRTMLDVGQTPDQFLRGLPRIFPELAEREASWNRWASAKATLEAFLKATGPRRRPLLEEAITALRQKDQGLMPRDATAISSEGIPPGDPDVLVRFVDVIAPELASRTVSKCTLPVDKITRALGYTSTPDPCVQKHIKVRIKYEGADLQDYDLVACGSCLRTRPRSPSSRLLSSTE